MILLVEPGLMERAVFEATRGDARLGRQYHREFSRCYGDPEGDSRDRAFRTLHEEWFSRLGFRGLLLSVIGEFEFVRTRAQRAVFSSQYKKRSEGVELFGKPGRFTAAAIVSPVLLLDKNAFLIWARHEFQHIDDMLDPAFCFDPAACPSGPTTAASNRMRDRYAVVWSASIDARLEARGGAHPHARRKRNAELVRAFDLGDTAERDTVLAAFWNKLGACRPTHGTLLEWARNGPPGFASEEQQGMRTVLGAGAACPLCRFATYDWADSSSFSPQINVAVTADFPEWTPDEGICGQCAELYRSRSRETPTAVAGSHETPPPVLHR